MFGLFFLICACAASAFAGATFSAVVLKWVARQKGGALKQYAAARKRLIELGVNV
jgi:hypothetical protein